MYLAPPQHIHSTPQRLSLHGPLRSSGPFYHDLLSVFLHGLFRSCTRLARRLEIHYTPKHGSWLNVAEIELSALNSQCLNRRIPDIDLMRKEVAAWELDRNNRATTIDWRFTTEDARIKLKRLYPKL